MQAVSQLPPQCPSKLSMYESQLMLIYVFKLCRKYVVDRLGVGVWTFPFQ